MNSEHQKYRDEALLEQHAIRPVLEDREGLGSSRLTLLGFLFLTFNSGMALYRSNGDFGNIAFVIFSYSTLVLLFGCLRIYQREPAGSPRRRSVKMAVWSLTTMLTATFSYKVAEVMPFPVQVAVWTMTIATVLASFYVFFLHREAEGDKVIIKRQGYSC